VGLRLWLDPPCIWTFGQSLFLVLVRRSPSKSVRTKPIWSRRKMHCHNSLDAVSGPTRPRERSQYSWFVHNLANRRGLSGVHGPGFGPGASLRSAPATQWSFPIMGYAGALGRHSGGDQPLSQATQNRAWFKSGLQLRVAGVDARRATPPDPRPPRWGLAGSCQLDPSHTTASGNLRFGHRAPGRGGRRARRVSGCWSFVFLGLCKTKYTGSSVQYLDTQLKVM